MAEKSVDLESVVGATIEALVTNPYGNSESAGREGCFDTVMVKLTDGRIVLLTAASYSIPEEPCINGVVFVPGSFALPARRQA